MFIRQNRNHQSGDTIVEVLIAILVMSFVLGGAYISASSSLKGTREAKERENALKIVQSQVEWIKSLMASNQDALMGPAVPGEFCISSTGSVVASSTAACKVGVDGEPTAAEPAFNLKISRDQNTFTVTNTWNSLKSDGQNTIDMRYRVYD